jgi:hypothetical protein
MHNKYYRNESCCTSLPKREKYKYYMTRPDIDHTASLTQTKSR